MSDQEIPHSRSFIVILQKTTVSLASLADSEPQLLRAGKIYQYIITLHPSIHPQYPLPLELRIRRKARQKEQTGVVACCLLVN